MKTYLPSLFLTLASLAGIHQANGQGSTVFPIATNAALIEYSAGIAFDGTNYLVQMLTGTNGNSATNVVVQLVSASGAILGPQTTVGGGAKLNNAGGSGLAFGGTNYLAVWSDDTISSGVSLFGQFVSRAGAKVGAKFNLLAAQGAHGLQTKKAMDFDGTNFLVVWQDGNNNYLYGQLVTPAGALSGSEFLLTTLPTGGTGVAVTFGRTNYLVVWQSNIGGGSFNNQTYGQFVSRTGSAGTPFQISQSASTDYDFLAVAFDTTNYLAVWSWNPGPETQGSVTNWQLFGRFISQSGTFPGAELSLVPVPNPVVPALAFDGANYLLAYGFNTTSTNADRNVRCQFLDRSGNYVGPVFTPFSAQGTNRPLIALQGVLFDGTRFVLAATLGTLGVSGQVYGTFLPASSAPPKLTATGPLAGTHFPMLLTGTPGINYTIEASTNLIGNNWTAMVTNSPTNGIFSFTDLNATNKSRFYRAVKR